EALGVDLVHRLSAGGTSGEPAMLGDHLDTPNGRTVAGGGREDHLDLLTDQGRRLYLLRRQALEHRLLLRRDGRIEALVKWLAELPCQLTIMLTRLASRPGGDLRRQQVGHEPVLIRGPNRAVAAQKGRPRALLAAEPERPIDEPINEPFEAHRHLDQPPTQV